MFNSTFAAFALVAALAAGAAVAPVQAAGLAGSDNPSLESFSGSAAVQSVTRFQTAAPGVSARAVQYGQGLHNPSTEGYVGGNEVRHPAHGGAQMAEGRMDFDWIGEVEGGA